MLSILYALGVVVTDLVKSRARLEAEILLFRHQLNLALRHAPPRVRLHQRQRAFFIPTPGKGETTVQSNDVFVDERGYIFLLDRLRGLDILQFTAQSS